MEKPGKISVTRGAIMDSRRSASAEKALLHQTSSLSLSLTSATGKGTSPEVRSMSSLVDWI